MKEELLFKDLCGRLPYGIKVDTGHFTPTKLTSKNFCNVIKYRAIPYLFPISCLTKPITINGESFVPIVELAKQKLLMKKTNPKAEYEYFGNNQYSACQIDGMTVLLIDFDFLKQEPFWIIEKLNEWHINYRLEPDQFIEVIEENNPYK